ncbi:MAG: VWA domain-containing protein [Ardenticatenales bacterium]|nr:VWA domain-containing protein [Ardenticatenales bacterium]
MNFPDRAPFRAAPRHTPGDRPGRRALAVVGALALIGALTATLSAFDAAAVKGQEQDSCSLAVDKTAAPGRIWLGEEVTVTLSITGSCTAREIKSDVVLVIDRSRSMLSAGKFVAARAAAKNFIDRADANLIQIGIVAFDDVAESVHFLSTDKAALKAAVDGISPDTGTNLVDGLDEGRKMLASAGRRADARPVIIFLTDGRHSVGSPPITDLPRVVADVRAAGILVYTIGLGNDIDESNLRQMASDPTKYFRSPTAAELEAIYLQLVGTISATELMKEAFIVDELPADMTFIPGSGQPAEPTLSPDGRTLTWRLVSVAMPPPMLTLTYRVRPTRTGTRPTNVEARADVTDGFGKRQTLLFPVPSVLVLAPVTPTPPPTATPPPAGAQCVCRVTRNKVPQSVIDAALADPSKVYGWQYPLNPNVPGPVLPNNPPRTCLDLQNRGLQYHPLFNNVIWRAGCLIGPP